MAEGEPTAAGPVWRRLITDLSLLSFVATVVGGTVAFFIQRSDEIHQRGLEAQAVERESKKPFLEKQSELYFAVVPLVSRIAVGGPEAASDEDIDRFWQLYWGELGMVEDRHVESAMKHVGQLLQGAIKNGPGSPAGAACRVGLRNASLLLSHRVRQSLFASWGVADATAGQADVPSDDTLEKQVKQQVEKCPLAAPGSDGR